MRKILLIEDETMLRRNTVKMIQLTDSLEDIEIKDFGNAKDALDSISIFKPNLIISDFFMPFMNGKEFVTALRNMEEFKTTPVILLSAKPDVSAIITDPCIDYLMKPFLYKELVEKIEANLPA